MPSSKEVKTFQVNPFAIAGASGAKPGSTKYERIVMAVTKKERAKIGLKRSKK